MQTIESLLAVSRAYAEGCGVELKTVSSRVFDDGKVLDRVAGGGDISARRADAALIWFASNWPDSVAWPDEVRRPEVEAAA